MSSSGSLLASLPVKVITYFTVIEVSSVILVSYVLAVSLGHEPAFLPMISDCAIKSPEMYIFRYGLIVGACLVAINFMVVYAATKSSYRLAKFCLVGGLIASFGLGLLTAVNEKENNAIHGTAAVIFFVLYEVDMAIISYNGQSDPRVSRLSINMKRFATIMTGVSLIVLAALSPQWGKHHTAIAVCEWLAVVGIQIFNLSFVHDFADIRLDEVGKIAVSRTRFSREKLLDNFV